MAGITRTSLTAYAGSMREPDPAGAERFAREAWQRHGSIVFTQADLARMTWQDRELVTQMQIRRFGPRRNG